MVESFFRSPVRIVAAVCLFPLFQMFVQFLLKGFLRVIFTCIEIEVENRVLPPFFLQSIDGQSFEKLLLPLEVCLQSADQKALAEPARTAQKICRTCADGSENSICRSLPVHIYWLSCPHKSTRLCGDFRNSVSLPGKVFPCRSILTFKVSN